MMREMGREVSPLTVADHFADLLTGFVLDDADAALNPRLALPVLATDTIMTDQASKAHLAQAVLTFALSLAVQPLRSAPHRSSLRPAP